MKRLFALILAAAMIAALLCACGGNNNDKSGGTVTTTVSTKYDDGYAKQFAESSKTDENGNTTYEFSGDKYKSYTQSHNNTISKNIQKDIAANHDKKYGEYVYINEDKQAVIVGVHTEKYKEDEAKAEAPDLAEYGFKYFQNLQNPVNTIKVIYANANNQSEELGVFEFTAE